MLSESPDRQDKPLWQITGICRQYGRKAVLKDISFSLEKGQVLGLLGPNGSGKTTLLEITALAARPNAGSILMNGIDILSRPGPVRPLIGYVPQDIALFEELTVMDNLLCWSQLPREQSHARIDEISAALSLKVIAGQKVSTLSGGMKRRVNLGVALLGYPSLLVLDEPFSGVDMDHREIMQDFLKHLAVLGVSQIISGHSMEDLLPLSDKIMVLSSGQVHFYDDAAVFRRMASDADGQVFQACRAILNASAAEHRGNDTT
jgi:ABC-2 type transport system ATP-binding protein